MKKNGNARNKRKWSEEKRKKIRREDERKMIKLRIQFYKKEWYEGRNK